MTLLRLLLDDEGEIARRQWWIGTLLLVAAHAVAGLILHRLLGARHLDGPIMIFLSIAILIPFYAVNAKRFRAIGRSPNLALWGGVLTAAAVLQAQFLPSPALSTGIGWAMIAVIAWYIIDLGLFPHADRSAETRLDGDFEQA
jgi:uncharacterized membrane protein YhaH (DUF805 family)